MGAACGVFFGQLLYASGVYAVSAAQHHASGQRVPTPKMLLMGLEHAGLLASAAFCSGSCWQPVANLMQGARAAHASAGGHLRTRPTVKRAAAAPGQRCARARAARRAARPDTAAPRVLTPFRPSCARAGAAAPVSADPNTLFLIVLLGLWAIEGCIFFLALHAFRFLYADVVRLEGIESAFSRSSLIYDATLALSIGGAAGFFFATNGSYATNVLTRAFGVMPWTGPWEAALMGGGSNASGFIFAQAVQNVLFPANSSWADSRKKGQQQLKYTEGEVLLPYRTPFG